MPKGLALLMTAKPKDKGMGMGGEKPLMPEPEPSAEDDYGAELAAQVGAKDPAAFTAALKGFVRECMKSEEAGEYDEEG